MYACVMCMLNTAVLYLEVLGGYYSDCLTLIVIFNFVGNPDLFEPYMNCEKVIGDIFCSMVSNKQNYMRECMM